MSEFLARDARIYVAGHGGLVGSAIWRALETAGYRNLHGWRSAELDLRDQVTTDDAVATLRPDVMVMAAARVGGILANSQQPVEFINDNLRIQTNLLEAAHRANVPRVLFLGSSCIYPKLAPQPITEDALLTGPLEATNQAYALAKIAGIVAVQSYRHEYGRAWISAMPTNLYGPGDNFNPLTSHVLPAMIRKFHDAHESGSAVTLWGSGRPRREFLHTDDMASAAVFLLENYDHDSHINVGTGLDVSIKELADGIRDVVGFQGEVHWDTSKPDGTPRKLLDVSRLRELGWQAQIPLDRGIETTYEWFRARPH